MAEQDATEEAAHKPSALLHEGSQKEQVDEACDDINSELIHANNKSHTNPALPSLYSNQQELENPTKSLENKHVDNGEGLNLVGETINVESQYNEYSLRARKWTDEELRSYLSHHYLWLHDDPETAKVWQLKVLQGSNPVQSLANVRKWQEWRVRGKPPRMTLGHAADDGNGEPKHDDLSTVPETGSPLQAKCSH
jgi:hypothetical protein